MAVEFRERIAADIRAVAVDPIIIDRLTVTGQTSQHWRGHRIC
jgi:hypothetical protein